MTGVRVVIVLILATALAAGALLWWTLTRAYYREVVTAEAGELGVALPDGSATALRYRDGQFLGSDSSPIRDRACLVLDDPDAADALPPYEGATPLNAPSWFGCYDARAVDEALKAGQARAVLAPPPVALPYGVDRVMAAFPDGRAFLWQQMNPCGEALYGGGAQPPGCADPPGGLRFDERPTE